MKAKDVVYDLLDRQWAIYLALCKTEGARPALYEDWGAGFICGFVLATKGLTGRAMKPDDIVIEET